MGDNGSFKEFLDIVSSGSKSTKNNLREKYNDKSPTMKNKAVEVSGKFFKDFDKDSRIFLKTLSIGFSVLGVIGFLTLIVLGYSTDALLYAIGMAGSFYFLFYKEKRKFNKKLNKNSVDENVVKNNNSRMVKNDVDSRKNSRVSSNGADNVQKNSKRKVNASNSGGKRVLTEEEKIERLRRRKERERQRERENSENNISNRNNVSSAKKQGSIKRSETQKPTRNISQRGSRKNSGQATVSRKTNVSSNGVKQPINTNRSKNNNIKEPLTREEFLRRKRAQAERAKQNSDSVQKRSQNVGKQSNGVGKQSNGGVNNVGERKKRVLTPEQKKEIIRRRRLAERRRMEENNE